MSGALHAFEACGIELEYMIVDHDTLDVRPIADRLLRDVEGRVANEVLRGGLAWSNELVLHLIELKNTPPTRELETLPTAFQTEIAAIEASLSGSGARLMPTAMHPWMEPSRETRLWPHEHAEIYRAYDRLFDCRQHGFANIQCMHVNLPFADDREFVRLHAAVRLALPILPALAASSPLREGGLAGAMDARLVAYRSHQSRLPASMGQIIPDTALCRSEYAQDVLEALYRQLAPLDPEGVLRHEWLNARGAIPRFERDAIEIRLIDLQECPQADLAIAAAVIAVVRAIYEERWSSLEAQQAFATDGLADILSACTQDAEAAMIEEVGYLSLLGISTGPLTAGEIWRRLLREVGPGTAWQPALETILERGTLARRIVRALGGDLTREGIAAVYRVLCDRLAAGELFRP